MMKSPKYGERLRIDREYFEVTLTMDEQLSLSYYRALFSYLFDGKKEEVPEELKLLMSFIYIQNEQKRAKRAKRAKTSNCYDVLANDSKTSNCQSTIANVANDSYQYNNNTNE